MQTGYELKQEGGLQQGKSFIQGWKMKYLLEFWSFLTEK